MVTLMLLYTRGWPQAFMNTFGGRRPGNPDRKESLPQCRLAREEAGGVYLVCLVCLVYLVRGMRRGARGNGIRK
jgi:hypothetical protein